MADEKTTESVAPEGTKPTGNSEDLIKTGSSPNNIEEGKPIKTESQKVNLEDYVPKKNYEELSTKLGEQGNELGELREFAKEVAPLIEKVKENPALVEAIMLDKITLDLAQAVLDDKIKIEEATAVAEAHEEVKKELGEKGYKNASKEEIGKLVEDELKKHTAKIDSKLAELEGKDLEKKTSDFIKETPDYLDYADLISDYFKSHPNEYDVETVYYYVKGKDLSDKALKEKRTKEAEAAKDLAANAGGGGSQAGGKIGGRNVVDDLIAGGKNPNIF